MRCFVCGNDRDAGWSDFDGMCICQRCAHETPEARFERLRNEREHLGEQVAECDSLREQLERERENAETAAAEAARHKENCEGAFSLFNECIIRFGGIAFELLGMEKFSTNDNSMRDAVAGLLSERDSLREQLAAVTAERDELRIQPITQVEGELIAEKLAAMTFKRDFLQKRVGEVDHACDDLGERLAAMTAENDEMCRLLSEVQGDGARLRKKIAEVIAERDEAVARDVDVCGRYLRSIGWEQKLGERLGGLGIGLREPLIDRAVDELISEREALHAELAEAAEALKEFVYGHPDNRGALLTLAAAIVAKHRRSLSEGGEQDQRARPAEGGLTWT
jgi:hypothetical protein